jgi:hypothetical protein
MLRSEIDPACSKGFCQDLLALSDSPDLQIGHEYLVLFGLGDSSNSVVSGAGKLLALVGSGAGHSGEHGSRSIAWLYALAHKLAANGRTTDAEAFCKCLDAIACEEKPSDLLARVILGVCRRAIDSSPRFDAPSAQQLGKLVSLTQAERAGHLGEYQSLIEQATRIVEKRVRVDSAVHVFNLQTSCGWYVTQNLIVRNCRCYAEPDLTPLLGDLDEAADQGET